MIKNYRKAQIAFLCVIFCVSFVFSVRSLELGVDLDSYLTDGNNDLDSYLSDNLNIVSDNEKSNVNSSEANKQIKEKKLFLDDSGKPYTGEIELKGEKIPSEYSRVINEYKDGKLIKIQVFNKKNRKIIEENPIEKEFLWFQYHKNGKIKKESFLRNDERIYYKLFSENGKLSEEMDYKTKNVVRYNQKGEIIYKGDSKPKSNAVIENRRNPIVRFHTNRGNFDVLLYEKYAPVTVANFIYLVEEGFYNNTRFHRLVKDTIIQGGCPYSKKGEYLEPGTGNPGYLFDDEFHEKLKQNKYIVSMANSGPNTNGSQFFINLTDNSELENKYTAFGKVIKNTRVIGRLKKNDEIISITVLRKRNREYLKPEKIYKTK